MEFASLYRHVVHKRAVAAVEIRNDVFFPVLFYKGVAARDGGIPNPQARARLTADQHRSLAHRDDRVFQLASNSGEPWFHTFALVRGQQCTYVTVMKQQVLLARRKV